MKHEALLVASLPPGWTPAACPALRLPRGSKHTKSLCSWDFSSGEDRQGTDMTESGLGVVPLAGATITTDLMA